MYKYIDRFKAIEEIDKDLKILINKKNTENTVDYTIGYLLGLEHAKVILLGMDVKSLKRKSLINSIKSALKKEPKKTKFADFEGYNPPEETTTDKLINKYKKDLEEIKKRSKCYNCNFESFEKCLKCSYDDNNSDFNNKK